MAENVQPVLNDNEGDYPATSYAWFVVFVLTLANITSFIDRQILTLLFEAIKRDLDVSDTQLSLLHGFAFTILYTLLGLPIARLADRGSRKWLILAGVSIWSLMTAACGFANKFWSLFLFRVGVGVGEATLSPAGYSMIADYFLRRRMALPMGVFNAGVAAGMGIALVGGALLIDLGETLISSGSGLLSGFKDWQIVFLICGALGLPVICLMLLVREPIRRGVAGQSTETPPVNEIVAFLKTHRALYASMFLGYCCTAISVYGITVWTPAFYMRSFGVTASEAGVTMGFAIAAGGIIGTFSGGAIADALYRRGVAGAQVVVLMFAVSVAIVPSIVTPLLPSMNAAAVGLFFIFLVGALAVGPTTTAIQIITPNRMRAVASAIFLLCNNFIGLFVGPFAVAFINDTVFGTPETIRFGMAIVSGVSLTIGSVLVWNALRLYRIRLKELGISAPQSAT